MNFRIKIAKHLSIGPSGLRFLTKRGSIGASGLLLHGKGGSMWLPRSKRPFPGSKVTTLDNRYRLDWEKRVMVPTWYWNAKYGQNKPGTKAYQKIIPYRYAKNATTYSDPEQN